MNSPLDSLVQARAGVERLQSCFDRLREAAEAPAGAADADVDALAAPIVADFDEALDDDLNMSRALSAVFRFTTVLNQAAPTGAAAARAAELLLGFAGVLAVLDRRVRSGLVPRERLERDADAALPDGTLDVEAIERALAARQGLKRARDFRAADALREELRRRGVLVEDTPQGVRWRLLD